MTALCPDCKGPLTPNEYGVVVHTDYICTNEVCFRYGVRRDEVVG